eukprot:CAMPEP_0119119178 /NCGR_PEP_ID=MMETSP1310-20130426/780_1 /TAXON_ID=464262 /ORGANISM="Genus nov. species nov., Strain RCC2339" /LENGTH=592 /DNA_ID=CAMNT_0007108597 /DNA_START=277 /DNA_END=2055 /DNA_ORIENTATION=+
MEKLLCLVSAMDNILTEPRTVEVCGMVGSVPLVLMVLIGTVIAFFLFIGIFAAYVHAARAELLRPESLREVMGLRSFPAPVLSAERQEKVNRMSKTLDELHDGLPQDVSYGPAAEVVTAFVKTRELTADHTLRGKSMIPLWDLHGYCAPHMAGGIDVRITVQYNLFTGSVMNLGCAEQQEKMREIEKRGELGGFFLTEEGAGVLSGLIVNTTATYHPEDASFILHSPAPVSQSAKYWISQALTAKWGVVIARLLMPDGSDKGPHAFLVDLTLPGIHMEDMESKVDFNWLDNGRCWFENVRLSDQDLLRGMCFVDEGGYHLRDEKSPFNFIAVAQRLLSGRICIAGATLCVMNHLVEKTHEYARGRPIPTGRNETTPLAEMPFFADSIDEVRMIAGMFRHYTDYIQDRFMTERIGDDLVHEIACAKSEVAGFCIDTCERLKKTVGSYALFQDSPYGTKPDILYVMRFAEGDSSILRQKMVRDAVKALAKKPAGLGVLAGACNALFQFVWNKDGLGYYRAGLQFDLVRLAVRMAMSGKNAVKVWLHSHNLVTYTARRLAALTIHDALVRKFPECQNSREMAVFRKYYMSSVFNQ